LSFNSRPHVLLFMHFLMEIYLIFESRLHMRILIGAIKHGRRFCWVHYVLSVARVSVSSCFRSWWRAKLRHLSTSVAFSVWVRSIVHPRFLMSLWRWTIAHDNSSIFFAAYNTIISVFNVLILIRWSRSIHGARSVVTIFLNWFLNRFKLLSSLPIFCLLRILIVIVSILVEHWTIRVLRVSISMMITA
jgi:hypothetical protein